MTWPRHIILAAFPILTAQASSPAANLEPLAPGGCAGFASSVLFDRGSAGLSPATHAVLDTMLSCIDRALTLLVLRLSGIWIASAALMPIVGWPGGGPSREGLPDGGRHRARRADVDRAAQYRELQSEHPEHRLRLTGDDITSPLPPNRLTQIKR